MNNKHKSDTLLLGALLSLSGGFQDAYTYVLRGNVFANAQTGNVVFMSQRLMTGDFRGALRYFLPLVAFASGILVAFPQRPCVKSSKNRCSVRYGACPLSSAPNPVPNRNFNVDDGSVQAIGDMPKYTPVFPL